MNDLKWKEDCERCREGAATEKALKRMGWAVVVCVLVAII